MMQLVRLRCRETAARAVLYTVVFLAGTHTSATNTSAAVEDDADRPFGIQTRVPLTTSRLVGRPEPPPPMRAVRQYPYLTVERIIDLKAEPGSNRYLAARTLQHWSGPSQVGFVWDHPESCEFHVLLDSPLLVYGIALHPDYDQNRYLYVFGNLREGRQEGINQVLRYTVPDTFRARIDPQTEHLILQWKSAGHDGGGIAFGPDEMLYLATGDGSGGSDAGNKGQTLDNLCAKVLRIDVKRPSDNAAYSVPPDNPFLNTPGARPETWAYGFRNPWRLTYDWVSGQLWAGNNGQDLWESAHLVRRGENYGWPIVEGGHDFHPYRQRGPDPIVPPTVEHSHLEARSLTGGVVYHGTDLPLLSDAYVYGDFSTGKIWAARHDGDRVVWHREIADTTLEITGFAVDHRGELLVLDYGGGGVYGMEPVESSSAQLSFPRKLSQTGLFESVADHRLRASMLPYSVNAPRWTDYAMAERYIGIPGEEHVTFSRRGSWEFPEQTVLLKTFFMEFEASRPASRRPIETQILTLQDGEWAGYTYRWNEARTDGELVEVAGMDVPLKIRDKAAPDGIREQVWHYPSRAECIVCHNRAVDYVLGVTTAQLNRDHDYGTNIDNQLRTLNHLGIFSSSLRSNFDRYPRLTNPHDERQPIDRRARSYLHANCQHCHVREGGGNAELFLSYSPSRFQFSWNRVPGYVDAKPRHGDFNLLDARIIAAGIPEQSVLLYRMAKLGRGRMPYAGSQVIDEAGVALIDNWIAELAPADDQSAQRVESRRQESEARLLQLAGTEDPLQRKATISDLCGTTSGAMLLMRGLDRAQFPSDLRHELVALTTQHPSEHVRDLFERFLPPSDRAVRLGAAFDPQRVLALAGEASRGRDLFFQASGLRCAACHRIQTEGGMIGPDLSGVGKKYSKPKLLAAILDPSRDIDPQWATQRIVTNDGRLVTGVVVTRDEQSVTLRDATNQTNEIALDTIESMAPQSVSLMPQLLLKDLTAQQAADLLSYLSAQTKVE